MEKKKIGIMIPCYNEQENIVQICNAVVKEITEELPQYDYEILIMDNCSTDNTRPLIREICKKNPKIKAILNAKNFGQFNSPYYGMLHVDGDCVIPICADFQDPVEMIPKFIHEWENGYKIVCAIKSSSKENKLMYWARSCYYKMIKKMSSVEQIEHFTGFALYDKAFIDVLKNLNDPTPFIRGIVAELGFKRKDIEFEQPKRKAGKTHNNFYSLYDAAMLSFTSYTKMGLRIATFAGFGIGILSFLIGIIYLIMKLIWWNRFPGGTAPAIICSMFLGGIQLFFLGFLGEYIMSMNARIMNRPLVVEEERINFDDDDKKLIDEDKDEKNKLKKDNLLTIDKLYFALSFLLIAVAFLVIVLSRGKAFDNLFWHGKSLGFYPDLFESVIHARTRNPYKLDAIYPAFAYCLIYFFNFFIPGTYKNNFDDLQKLCDQSETFVIAHIFYAMITLALAYFIIKSFGETKYKGKYALVLIFFTSSPYIFLIERGNTVIITILFLFVYVLFYNSENKVLRELALICLACAAAMKLYPALFGLLLLSDKKYKEAVRAVIYGIVLLVVPFFFMGGVGQIPQMLKNSLTLNNNTLSGSTGFGYGFKVNATSSIGSIFDWLFAKNYTVYIKMLVYFFVVLLLVGSLFIKKKWKRIAAISLVVILMPDFSFIYNVIYLIIPLIFFIKDVKGKKITFLNTIYMLCFVGAFAPLPYGDIFRSVGGYNNMNVGTMISSLSLILLALFLTGEGVYKMFKQSKKIIVCGTLVFALIFGAVPYVLADNSEPEIQTIKSVWQLNDSEKSQVSDMYNFVKDDVKKDDEVLCFPKVDSLSDFDKLNNHLWYSSVEAKDSITATRVFKKHMPKYVVLDLSNYSNYMQLIKSKDITDTQYDSLMSMQNGILKFLNKYDYKVVKYVKTENNRYIALWENGDSVSKDEENFWNDGGDGTREKPYIISSSESLVEFSDVTNCGKTFEDEFVALSNNIDMSDVEKFTPISRFDTIGMFKGVFDGNGNTISNLNMKYSMTTKANDASNIAFINNLYGTLTNLKIENSIFTGYNAAVFVRTSNRDKTAIVNCVSSGNNVKATNRASIFGDKYGAVIVNGISYNDTVSGVKNEGFIGVKNASADIRNCYTTTSDSRNYATSVSIDYINSQAIVSTLNESATTFKTYQFETNKKAKKLKKKYKIAEYNQWQIKDGKLDFVK